jgi:ferredoxin
MASTITDDCIGCGNCEPGCPCGAISRADEVYVVDPEMCGDCVATGGCVGIAICPTEAIIAAAMAGATMTAVAI